MSPQLTNMLCYAWIMATVLWLACGHHIPDHHDDIVVKTALGKLRGSILNSRKGRTIYSFRGVRFAKPPVGGLRFKAPVPLDPWEGIENATEDGFACPQIIANTTLPTSEDCLFLNVYTTELPKNGRNPRRPVLVYFHSGAFFFNMGHSAVHGPQYLMDQDMVLVVPNYRLAALGFLSTGDGVLPGNYGMKDQVATLRWVKQNIAAFGGDPNSVTISGCSVGGASILLHMISPMSKGLFHRGISVSIGMNPMWDLRKNPLPQAKKQAALLKCPAATPQQIADCMRQKGAQEIASTYKKMLVWGFEPILEYMPVIEVDSGEERFLTEHPLKSLLEGKFMNIPWITGVNKDECDYWAVNVINNRTLADDLYQRFEELAPIIFMYQQDSDNPNHMTQVLRDFYLHNKTITEHSLEGLGNLYSDAALRHGFDQTSKLVSKMSKEPVYAYLFKYQGRYSHNYWPGTRKPFGVVHHDDLIYLFRGSAVFPEFTETDPEVEMIEKLTKLWANFIQTGNPTPEKTELFNNVTWERMTPENPVYLSIDNDLKMEARMFEERMALWDKLLPPKV